MLFGLLNEAAMLIGQAKDRKAERKRVGRTVAALLEGLRA
jgi:hypothetical protein